MRCVSVAAADTRTWIGLRAAESAERCRRSSTTSRCSCRSGCVTTLAFSPPPTFTSSIIKAQDGSTDGDGFVRVPVSNDGVSHRWMVETVQSYQHELMKDHDVVLTVDVDEIVAPNPEMGTLGEYIDRLDEPCVNCLGYEVIHIPDEEPPLDPSMAILEQRHYWFANDGYDKPALAMEPMDWVPGFHSRADHHFFLDPDLRLIHLHRMDYGICRARHRLRGQRNWGPEDVEQGWAAHNRLSSGEEFDRWYNNESGSIGVDVVLERIPDQWRGIV